VPTLFRELKRIRKGRYYRILDWAKKNPIKALLLTTLWAVALNIAANFAYDLCKAVVSHPANHPVANSDVPAPTNGNGGNPSH
jgi:hypothetical protein